MPCHVLCPGCGGELGAVYKFIKYAREGYYKSLKEEIPSAIKPDKIELCPNIAKPIGFIFDAAGLTKICCRMHMLGETNFDKIFR